MTSYTITVTGCDDETRISIDLTDAEHQTATLIADAITDAGGGCQPVMRITPTVTAAMLDALPAGIDVKGVEWWWTKLPNGEWCEEPNDPHANSKTSAALIAEDGPIVYDPDLFGTPA